MRADKNSRRRNFPKHVIKDSSIVPVLNGIHPNKDAIKPHELFTNFRTKIIVINRRFDVDPLAGKGPK